MPGWVGAHVGHRLFSVSLELELVPDETVPLLVKGKGLCDAMRLTRRLFANRAIVPTHCQVSRRPTFAQRARRRPGAAARADPLCFVRLVDGFVGDKVFDGAGSFYEGNDNVGRGALGSFLTKASSLRCAYSGRTRRTRLSDVQGGGRAAAATRS